MEIYIETFILENILINFCLLKLITLTTKSKSTFFRLFLSSLLGAISSVFSIIISANITLINLLKFLTASVMIICAFKPNFKQYISNIILLFLFTYSFAGLIISLSSSKFMMQSPQAFSYYSLEIICLLVIVATYIFEIVLKHIKLHIKTNNLIYNLTLTKGNSSIKLLAYLDTGNFINHNGKPVLILDIHEYLKLMKTDLISFITTPSTQIKTSTINGNGNLKVFEIDKIEFKSGKTKYLLEKQLVAINTTNCFKNTNYKALLSPLFL